MAEFCRQCSARKLGADFGDFAGITTSEQTAQGVYAEVLCEGCGPTQVDHEGACVGGCEENAHGR